MADKQPLAIKDVDLFYTSLGVNFSTGFLRCLAHYCSLLDCLADFKFHNNQAMNKEVMSSRILFATFGRIWLKLVICFMYIDIPS